MKNRVIRNGAGREHGVFCVASRFPLSTNRPHLRVVLALLIGLAFAALPAPAAVTEAWVQRYSNVMGGADDQAFKVVRDAAGDIIVTGTTDNGTPERDMLTIKYSGTDGSVLWQRRNTNGIPEAMTVDSSGNVLVTGLCFRENNGVHNADYYTAKYAAANGVLLWHQRYNGPANGSDWARAVAVDSSDNVVVTGSSDGSNGRPDYYTAKYAWADGALLWEKRYDGTTHSYDQASAVAVDTSGNVVVTGNSVGTSSSDFYTAKYGAPDGALLWEKRYDGPESREDWAVAVAVDAAGNVVVTGDSVGGGNGTDYYTAKYAAEDGALLWEQRFNGTGNNFDVTSALVVDGDGNAVVTGYSVNSSVSADAYTAKYAGADGALIWEKRYNGPEDKNDYGQAVGLDNDGNVVVTGFIGYYNGNGDYYTAKYGAASGALLWERRYNGTANSDDEGRAVVVDISGNVVVTGYSTGSEGTYDYYTAKYAASNGTLLWERRYDGPTLNTGDRATAVAMDREGNVVATGSSDGEYYTAKYSRTNGAPIWERRGPPGEPKAVAVDASGNVVVTGYSQDIANASLLQCYTAKYGARDGTLLWEQHYDGAANSTDVFTAIAVDSDSNVVVTGNSSDDYYTAKYAGTDGTLLWDKHYDGPASDIDSANAIAIDQSGNIIVTGFSRSNTEPGFFRRLDYYTAKYAGTDGTLLWERRYDGPEGSEDVGNAVATDGFGNVLVTGYSVGSGSSYDYYTAKYAAADGALLWEQRYNGPGNAADEARGLVVDRNGDAVVTGYSHGNASVFDYYTVKYAALNGSIVWEQRYNGAANVHDQASALALDGNGNVVVTGYSAGCDPWPACTYDFSTLKYAAADGAILWEKRYNGPANGDDLAGGLAVAHDGSVVVTGTSIVTGTSSGDAVTILYRESFPPVITWPSNTVSDATGNAGAVVHFTVTATDDSGVAPTVTCAPASGSVFPIGRTTVTCMATDGDGLSSTCSFTVTVRGARGIKQGVLAELTALRATVSDRDAARTLDAAIAHLTQSLAPEFWVDETHLERKHGQQVFLEEMQTVQNLCELIRSRTSKPSEVLLRRLADQLFQADRLLAVVAIEEAIAANLAAAKARQAQAFLAKGDAKAGDERCGDGIGDYRNAWSFVTGTRMD